MGYKLAQQSHWKQWNDQREKWPLNPVSLLDTGVGRTNFTAQSINLKSDGDQSCPRIYVNDTLRKYEFYL